MFIFINDKPWIEQISSNGVFEDIITPLIAEYNAGGGNKKAILDVTQKVAEYRNTPALIEEIKQRLNRIVKSNRQV